MTPSFQILKFGERGDEVIASAQPIDVIGRSPSSVSDGSRGGRHWRVRPL